MIIKDKIYKFEFYRTTKMWAKCEKMMYSDSDDIYALKDIPASCVSIKCLYKQLNKDKDWQFKKLYLIGDEIITEEAKEEIEKLNKLKVTNENKDAKENCLLILEAISSGEKSSTKVYINKGVELNEQTIRDRIIIDAWWARSAVYISPSQIINGRIYPIINGKVCLSGETSKMEDKSKENCDKPYIELE